MISQDWSSPTSTPALLAEIADNIGVETARDLPDAGVIVLGVSRSARTTGLRPGDVIRAYNLATIDSAAALLSAVARAPRVRELLVVRRGAETLIRYGG